VITTSPEGIIRKASHKSKSNKVSLPNGLALRYECTTKANVIIVDKVKIYKDIQSISNIMLLEATAAFNWKERLLEHKTIYLLFEDKLG